MQAAFEAIHAYIFLCLEWVDVQCKFKLDVILKAGREQGPSQDFKSRLANEGKGRKRQRTHN